MKLKVGIFQEEAKDAVPQTFSLWAGSFEVPNTPGGGLGTWEASYLAPEQLAAPAKVPVPQALVRTSQLSEDDKAALSAAPGGA